MILCGRKKYLAPTWVIVILVVGFLVWTMLLPYENPMASENAKALKIVDSMREIKTAVLMLYVDNLDSIDSEYRINGQTIDEFADTPGNSREIMKYYSGKDSITLKGSGAGMGEYRLAHGIKGGGWFVGYGTDGEKEGVKTRLAGKVKSAGLLKYPEKDSPPYNHSNNDNTAWVWMMIL